MRLKAILFDFFRQLPSMLCTGHDSIPWHKTRTLGQHQVHLRGSAEGKHLEPLRVACHHVQRTGANRPRGAEHRDPLLHVVTSVESIMASGRVGSSASTRSSTPPWPGSRLMLSFTPALRLMSDSIKSPTTLMAAMNNTPSSSSHQPWPARRV